ncbi:hypothetical protein VPHK479_0064 [Vibrio phage K479]
MARTSSNLIVRKVYSVSGHHFSYVSKSVIRVIQAT